jgi:hypothetical protein
MKIFNNIHNFFYEIIKSNNSRPVNVDSEQKNIRVRCSHCGIFLNEETQKENLLCESCYNHFAYEDDTPKGELTFITSVGGSYSGSEIYFNHSSKKLIGHHYVWHIDDGKEYTGWFDETLEDILKDILDEMRFGYKIDKTLEKLYEFFGSEVDDMIKKIKKQK